MRVCMAAMSARVGLSLGAGIMTLAFSSESQPPTLGQLLREKDLKLGVDSTTLLELRFEHYISAIREGKISSVSIPILTPKATIRDAVFCCSGKWRLRKNDGFLRKAADEGGLVLPQGMSFCRARKYSTIPVPPQRHPRKPSG